MDGVEELVRGGVGYEDGRAERREIFFYEGGFAGSRRGWWV